MGFAAPAIVRHPNTLTAFAHNCSAMVVGRANCKLRYLQ